MHYHENRCHHTNTDRRTIYVYIGLYMDDHILTTVTHLQTFLMPPELGETVSWASMKIKLPGAVLSKMAKFHRDLNFISRLRKYQPSSTNPNNVLESGMMQSLVTTATST